MDPQTDKSEGNQPPVNLVTAGGGEDEESRKRVLISLLEEGLTDTPLSEKEKLIAVLIEGERGETDLTLYISTLGM